MGIFNVLPQLVLSGKRTHGEYSLMEEVPRSEYGASKKPGTLTNGKGSRRLERQMPPTPQLLRQVTCFMDSSSLSLCQPRRQTSGPTPRAVSLDFETPLPIFGCVLCQ